jgi:hypothetical protein
MGAQGKVTSLNLWGLVDAEPDELINGRRYVVAT